MRQIEPARSLRVMPEQSARSLVLHYQIDQTFSGSLAISTPFDLPTSDTALIGAFVVLGTVFLAQLCLAREAVCDAPAMAYLVSAMAPTIRTLYAIRSSRDCVTPVPRLTLRFTQPEKPRTVIGVAPNKNAVQLWSGGLDSTLSHILLRQNDYQVVPLHVTSVNGHPNATSSELRAVRLMAGPLQTPVERADVQFDQFMAIAEHYSSHAGRYPDINPIPHGRELLLLPLALAMASARGSSNICLGIENSAWTETFEYEGQTYSRYDTQSEFCLTNLQDTISRYVCPGMRVFSPIAPLTEYRKLVTMVSRFPHLAAHASFCYWGTNCGLCQKCSLYYLLQRSLGLDVIPFEHNPITERVAYILKAMDESANPDWRERNLALARIVQRGDKRPNEDLLDTFQCNVLPQIEDLLDDWERQLMSTHPVALLPPDFDVSGAT